MDLNVDVNFDRDFTRDMEDFISTRLESLNPAALPPEASEAIRRLNRLFDEIDLLILPQLSVEKITDFRVIEDLLTEAVYEHQKNTYKLGFYDAIKFMLSMFINQREE